MKRRRERLAKLRGALAARPDQALFPASLQGFQPLLQAWANSTRAIDTLKHLAADQGIDPSPRDTSAQPDTVSLTDSTDDEEKPSR
jgi:hypothetical protein